MDHIRDYQAFQKILARICATFDKFVSDELVESWWKALRDLPLQTIEARANTIIGTATAKTKFPRPGEFRPDSKPFDDGNSSQADQRVAMASQKHWQEFIKRFPKTGPLRLRLAQAAAAVASHPENSAAYAEAKREYHAIEASLGKGGRFAVDC